MKKKAPVQRKLRVLINSNSIFSQSGYGQQIAEFVPRIRDAGYPVAMSNFYGSQGGKFALDGIVQYPVINHVYGSDAMLHHGRDFNADVVFSLQDIWTLDVNDLKQIPRYIPIVPVDHEPIPGIVLERLNTAYRVVTYSKFGYNQLLSKGVMSTYIPHTVNTDIFKPLDKKERKRAAKLPEDCFLFGMVGANKDNPSRKSFQETLDAFKMILPDHPNALLYLHTNPKFPGGFPVDDYATFLGIKDKVLFPDFYQMSFNTPKEAMNLVYNTFDCLLAPSKNEGFGVPIIEAQACGVPVITTNFTAMKELVVEGETGYLIEPIHKQWTGLQSYVALPDTKGIAHAMKQIYLDDREEMGRKARANMIENYDTRRVFDNNWKPFLRMLEKEVYSPVDNK